MSDGSKGEEDTDTTVPGMPQRGPCKQQEQHPERKPRVNSLIPEKTHNLYFRFDNFRDHVIRSALWEDEDDKKTADISPPKHSIQNILGLPAPKKTNKVHAPIPTYADENPNYFDRIGTSAGPSSSSDEPPAKVRVVPKPPPVENKPTFCVNDFVVAMACIAF